MLFKYHCPSNKYVNIRINIKYTVSAFKDIMRGKASGENVYRWIFSKPQDCRLIAGYPIYFLNTYTRRDFPNRVVVQW